MPNAFLFDIGNVIITFDFTKAVRKLAAQMEASPQDALPLLAPLTRELELGRLAPDFFIEVASRRIGYRGDPVLFRSAFEDIFELNLPMVDFIEKRKAEGFPLFVLSNTNAIHAPYFEATYPVFDLFDGRVYSHEVGLMKPDPAIYETARAKLPLDPGETVYIDDLAENCEAGRAAGFPSIRYEADDHEAFLQSIAALT